MANIYAYTMVNNRTIWHPFFFRSEDDAIECMVSDFVETLKENNIIDGFVEQCAEATKELDIYNPDFIKLVVNILKADKWICEYGVYELRPNGFWLDCCNDHTDDCHLYDALISPVNDAVLRSLVCNCNHEKEGNE